MMGYVVLYGRNHLWHGEKQYCYWSLCWCTCGTYQWINNATGQPEWVHRWCAPQALLYCTALNISCFWKCIHRPSQAFLHPLHPPGHICTCGMHSQSRPQILGLGRGASLAMPCWPLLPSSCPPVPKYSQSWPFTKCFPLKKGRVNVKMLCFLLKTFGSPIQETITEALREAGDMAGEVWKGFHRQGQLFPSLQCSGRKAS